MNMGERSSSRHQPPPPHHRSKTPSFSSSLLDSILRSIDDDTHLQQQHHHHYDHDLDLMFFANSKQPKRSHLINEQEQMPSTLRRAIMIDQWMDNRNAYNNNNNNNPKFSWDSSSSTGTTTFTTSSETETPSTYGSLPNSFTISRDPNDDTQKAKPKFMKSTRLRAMKIYCDLKKVKQPISPGSRISAFIYSLFASSKKSKVEDSMHNFIKQQQDTGTRSCMSKKQHSLKRSVRFYPDNVDNHRKSKSVHDQRVSDSSKYERRRWFTDNHMVEDEDDLFELEIVGGVAYRQELPVFETTDLRKIRII